MGLLYNPLSKRVQVKAFGNYFEFAAGQVKSVNDDVARFVALEKKESGVVELPEICINEPDSEEAKAVKEKKRLEGLNNALSFYKGIVKNLEVSLRRDLDQKNDKSSVYAYASEGEIEAAKMVKELTQVLDAVSANKEKEAEDVFSVIKDKL